MTSAHGVRFILIGVGAGVVMAVGVTRLLATMFFGIAATDAATIGQVAAVVAAASVLASAVPVARAGRLVASVLKAD